MAILFLLVGSDIHDVKAQSSSLTWISEEWINPNYKVGVGPISPYKIILNCQDSDNNCVNNILSGQGIKSISVYAKSSVLCQFAPDDPCFYGSTSQITYSGGNKATAKVFTNPGGDQNFWEVILTYDETTLKAIFNIEFGCSPPTPLCTNLGSGITLMSLENKVSRSELKIIAKVVNDDGSSAKPSDFNTFINHKKNLS